MSCPLCGIKRETVIICDNDCGTFICSEHGSYHEFPEFSSKYIIGHNPICNDTKKLNKYHERVKLRLKEKEINDADIYRC